MHRDKCWNILVASHESVCVTVSLPSLLSCFPEANRSSDTTDFSDVIGNAHIQTSPSRILHCLSNTSCCIIIPLVFRLHCHIILLLS
jgi:hypothetical protein